MVVVEGSVNKLFTFELFVCVAILLNYKSDLMKCKDVADIFTFISRYTLNANPVSCHRSLVEHMNLDDILDKAEEVFFEYCRKSAVVHEDESFLLVSDAAQR